MQAVLLPTNIELMLRHGRGGVTCWPSSGEKKEGTKMAGHSLEVQSLHLIPSQWSILCVLHTVHRCDAAAAVVQADSLQQWEWTVW